MDLKGRCTSCDVLIVVEKKPTKWQPPYGSELAGAPSTAVRTLVIPPAPVSIALTDAGPARGTARAVRRLGPGRSAAAEHEEVGQRDSAHVHESQQRGVIDTAEDVDDR